MQAQKAIDAGVIPPHEILRVQIEVAKAEREMEDDIHNLELARLALNKSLEFPDAADVQVTDTLKFNPLDESLESLQEMARANQPLLNMVDRKEEMAEAKLRLDKSGLMPEVFAFGRYSFFREQYPVVPSPFILGVQLNWNIFDGLQNINKVKAARTLHRQVEYAREYALNEVELWVAKSYNDVQNYRAKYEKLAPTVELAEKNLKINRKRFSEGLARSIDVLDAEMLYKGALTERLHALFNYYKALTELYKATGRPEKTVEIFTR